METVSEEGKGRSEVEGGGGVGCSWEGSGVDRSGWEEIGLPMDIEGREGAGRGEEGGGRGVEEGEGGEMDSEEGERDLCKEQWKVESCLFI